MPLTKSKSKEAFSKNIKAEVGAGKPLKQAIAIAYSVKRRAHKAKGGQIMDVKNKLKELNAEAEAHEESCPDCYAQGGMCPVHADPMDRSKYAQGGNVELEQAAMHNPLSLSQLAMQKRHPDKMQEEKYAQGGPVSAEGYD